MKASRFTGDPAPDGHAVATGDSSRGAPRSALEHPYGEYGYQYRGMGGIVSTAWDLWRWDRALADGTLLSAKSVAEMTSNPIGGHSTGWQIEKAVDGKTIHHHNGSVRGFLADVRRYPHINGCLVVLWNSDTDRARSAFSGFVQMCEQVLLKPVEAPVLQEPAARAAELSLEDLHRFSGRYHDTKGRVLVIVSIQQQARMMLFWDAVKITPGYLAEDVDSEYTFRHGLGQPLRVGSIEDADGKVRKLTVGPMEFVRDD